MFRIKVLKLKLAAFSTILAFCTFSGVSTMAMEAAEVVHGTPAPAPLVELEFFDELISKLKNLSGNLYVLDCRSDKNMFSIIKKEFKKQVDQFKDKFKNFEYFDGYKDVSVNFDNLEKAIDDFIDFVEKAIDSGNKTGKKIEDIEKIRKNIINNDFILVKESLDKLRYNFIKNMPNENIIKNQEYNEENLKLFIKEKIDELSICVSEIDKYLDGNKELTEDEVKKNLKKIQNISSLLSSIGEKFKFEKDFMDFFKGERSFEKFASSLDSYFQKGYFKEQKSKNSVKVGCIKFFEKRIVEAKKYLSNGNLIFEKGNNIIINEDFGDPLPPLFENGVLDLFMSSLFLTDLLETKVDICIDRSMDLIEKFKKFGELVKRNYIEKFLETERFIKEVEDCLNSLKDDERFNKNEHYVAVGRCFGEIKDFIKKYIIGDMIPDQCFKTLKSFKEHLGKFKTLVKKFVEEIIYEQPEHKKIQLENVYNLNLEIFKNFLQPFDLLFKEYGKFLVWDKHFNLPIQGQAIAGLLLKFYESFNKYIRKIYNVKAFEENKKKFEPDEKTVKEANTLFNRVTKKIDHNMSNLKKKFEGDVLERLIYRFEKESESIEKAYFKYFYSGFGESSQEEIEEAFKLFENYLVDIHTLLRDLVLEGFYISFNSISLNDNVIL